MIKIKKSIIILLLLTFNFLIQFVFAVEEKLQKIYGKEENAVYVNVVPLVVGQININYERLLSNKISFMVGLGAVNGFFNVSVGDDWSILTQVYKIGVGIYPAGRYGKTLRGIYFMPSYTGVIMDIKYKPENKTGSVSGTLVGVDIGHKWIWLDGVIVDLSVGMGFGTEMVAKIEDKTAGKIDNRIGVTHIGIQFGYAW